MDQDKAERIVILCASLIFTAAAAIIAVVFWLVVRTSDQVEERITAREPEKVGQVQITPNSGGAAPTLVPSATPEPLQGMSSPMFCKMHLAGLSNKAKEQGASGILTLDSYDSGKNACIFEVRNAGSLGNSMRIEIAQNTDTGAHGITLKTAIGKEEPLQKWGEAMLVYFSSDISADSANAAIQKALEGNTADIGHFSISARNDVSFSNGTVQPMRVIEIRSNTASSEN